MILVYYAKASPLLALDWVCHGFSYIHMYVCVFTTYDYMSIPCIFNLYKVRYKPQCLWEFLLQVLSLLPFLQKLFIIILYALYTSPFLFLAMFDFFHGQWIFVFCVRVKEGILNDPFSRIHTVRPPIWVWCLEPIMFFLRL